MRCDGSDHCIDGEVDDLNAVEFMDVRKWRCEDT
jgi:hypothetical protein